MRRLAHAGSKVSRFFSVMVAVSMLCVMVPAVPAGAVLIDTTPETWFVDPVTGSDDNGGLALNDAFASLTMAMSVAGPNDTIKLAQGTYAEEDYPLLIPGEKSPLKIVGAGAGKTVLDGGGMASLFITFDGADTTFAGLTFANGVGDSVMVGSLADTTHTGGAVGLWSSSATFSDCIFENNTAMRGGAIWADGSDIVVEGCEFNGNGVAPADFVTSRSVVTDELPAPEPMHHCEEGGAIALYGGSASIVESVFVGNEAYFAGAATFFMYSEVAVEDSVFDSNSISGDGGGLPVKAAGLFDEGVAPLAPSIFEGADGTFTGIFTDTIISGSLFTGNEAMWGSGVLLMESRAQVTDTDFVGNMGFIGPVTSLTDYWFTSTSIPSMADVNPAGVEPLFPAPQTTLERVAVTGNLSMAPVLMLNNALVTNCLIADNDGVEVPLALDSPELSLVRHTTIAGNDAPVSIVDLDMLSATAPSSYSNTQVYNSILWDGETEAASGCDVYYSDLAVGIGDPPPVPERAPSAQGYALDLDTNIYSDPLFASPANGNYRLVAGSPCIDTALDDEGMPVDDLDGLSRPVDGDGDTVEEPDMGCYEYFARTSGRVAGLDRYETAVQISRDHFAASDVVVLATGRTFADGLAASGLAGVYNAPLLLTDATYLPASVEAEILRLGASRVIVVGGTSAVGSSVASDIANLGLAVERIGGIDRYETAAQIAEEILALDADAGDLMFIARGDLFADALTASPVAYANHAPVLLVRPGELPAATVDVVEAAAGNDTDVVVVGGTSAVGSNVAALVSATDRIAGTDRYDTAADFSVWATENGYARWNVTGVATGLDFPDALSGGAGIGSQNGVLMLTPGTSVHPSVDEVLTDNGGSVLRLQLFGGINAVSDATRIQLMGYLN